MLGTRLLPPAYEHIDEEGKAHERRYRKLELEVERVDDAPLANIADPAVAHRSEDEKEDARDDFDTEFHDSEHHIVSSVTNIVSTTLENTSTCLVSSMECFDCAVYRLL